MGLLFQMHTCENIVMACDYKSFVIDLHFLEMSVVISRQGLHLQKEPQQQQYRLYCLIPMIQLLPKYFHQSMVQQLVFH